MKTEREGDHKLNVYLTEEDAAELGVIGTDMPEDDLADAVSVIVGTEPGFSYGRGECTYSIRRTRGGYTVTVSAKRRDGDAVGRCALCFDDPAALRPACAFLSALPVISSGLFYEDGADPAYYLTLTYERSGGPFGGTPYPLLAVTELCCGFYRDKNAVFDYIFEHCRPLIEKNAVRDIAKSEK